MKMNDIVIKKTESNGHVIAIFLIKKPPKNDF